MNENKIDCLGRIQQSHGLNGDFNSEFGNCSSQYFDIKQASNMGTCNQPFVMSCGGGGVEQPPYIGQGKSSSTIISRFESPATAFYATEICMGFPQYDCQQVSCGSYNLPVSQLSFSSQQEKLSPAFSAGNVSTTSGNPASNGSSVSSKTRIRWTQDLHEKFVECVNRLGGAEKATPKAILRLMESDGLTIFHVKSHLQKYRIAKYMPESTQGKSDKRTHVENVQLDVKTGLQIREALQLQLDVQRRLHEQLEIQRKLQLRIEEQGKQLKMMFDQQQKTSNDLLNTQNLSNTANSDKPNSPKDVEDSISEGSGKSLFHSKIS
ncbi:SANT/Myb domain [Sesbania bispinosa]|nr:SANT/Myb domain [Sesbania bispinosa]